MVAVDYGARFIDAGMRLQEGKAIEYGGLSQKKVAKTTDFEGVNPERVVFKQVKNWAKNQIDKTIWAAKKFMLGKILETGCYLTKVKINVSYSPK